MWLGTGLRASRPQGLMTHWSRLRRVVQSRHATISSFNTLYSSTFLPLHSFVFLLYNSVWIVFLRNAHPQWHHCLTAQIWRHIFQSQNRLAWPLKEHRPPTPLSNLCPWIQQAEIYGKSRRPFIQRFAENFSKSEYDHFFEDCNKCITENTLWSIESYHTFRYFRAYRWVQFHATKNFAHA